MLRPFAVLALVVVTSSGSPAAAQDSWPSKPITVIVPFGAGGNTDSLARIYSARLSARLGQQFVIENRVGAGSIIGITSLAKAAPDGYTIGIGTSAGLAINPAIMKENLGYNADKDLAYLHLMAIQPNLLVVHPSVPATSLPEFIAWVKANPDQAYATSGNGSSQHLCGEMLIQAAGIKMNAVAYRASNQQMQDLVGGQIKIACDNFSSAWEQVQAGKIRALAITSAKRYSFGPDIPTVAETLKGFEGASLVRMGRSDRRAEKHCRKVDRRIECRRPGAGRTQAPRYVYGRVLRPFRPSLCRFRPQGARDARPRY